MKIDSLIYFIFVFCLFLLFCLGLSNELLEREVENSVKIINSGEAIEDILRASNTIGVDLLEYNGRNSLPSIKVDQLNNVNRKSTDEKYVLEMKRSRRSFNGSKSVATSDEVNSDVTEEPIILIPFTIEDFSEDKSVENVDNNNQQMFIDVKSSINPLDHAQLFGQISDNISVTLIVNSSVNGVGTIYVACLCSIRNKNGCKVEKNNDIQSNIIVPLAHKGFPGQVSTLKEYIKKRLYEIGYRSRNETEFKNLIHDFMNYVSLELNLNKDDCNSCFCSVYNRADSFYNNNGTYLICFSSKIDDQNSMNSYSDFIDDVNYIKLILSLLITTDVFLFLTLIIYLALPELRRNVYGKCMVMYLFSMVISYFGIILSYQPPDNLGVLCDAVGFLLQFFWITIFSSQNVICYDIIRAFVDLKARRSTGNLTGLSTGDLKKLKLYMLYVYGVPGVITLITVIMHYGPFLQDCSRFKPRMDKHYCFISDRGDQTAISIYFFTPYGCMVVANFIMFLVTLLLIRRHTRDGRQSFRNPNYRKSNSASQKKEMFLVHLTLPFIMGLDKIYEFIFLIRGQTKTKFWFIPDLIFSLIGLYVFLVLVCKPNVIRLLGKKFKRMTSSVKRRGFCTAVVTASPKMNQPTNVTSNSTECFI